MRATHARLATVPRSGAQQTKCVMEEASELQQVSGSYLAFAKDDVNRPIPIDARVRAPARAWLSVFCWGGGGRGALLGRGPSAQLWGCEAWFGE